MEFTDPFILLSTQIARYCLFLMQTQNLWALDRWSRTTAHNTRYDEKEFYHLRELLMAQLPHLTSQFLATGLFALLEVDNLIGLAAASTPMTERIWRDYFLAGQVVQDIAGATKFSARSIRLQITRFPEMIARQLLALELAYSLKPGITPSPRTYAQRCSDALVDSFSLTEREAEVLLAFCPKAQNYSRKRLAEELDVTENTLKLRVRHIIRKLDVFSMFDAAAKARLVLVNVPPD